MSYPARDLNDGRQPNGLVQLISTSTAPLATDNVGNRY